jgi:hypothetical protein
MISSGQSEKCVDWHATVSYIGLWTYCFCNLAGHILKKLTSFNDKLIRFWSISFRESEIVMDSSDVNKGEMSIVDLWLASIITSYLDVISRAYVI